MGVSGRDGGVSEAALVSVSSRLPEPTRWGAATRIWGLQTERWGVHVEGDQLRRVHGEPHTGVGLLLPACYFTSEQAGTDQLIKAEFCTLSCKPPQATVKRVNGSFILTE